MKTDVECIAPTERASSAAKRMQDENIGFLPVCDDSGRVLGTLTDRDIAIRIVAQGRTPDTVVSDVMSKEIVCCRPEQDLAAAEEVMGNEQKSRLMVCDDSGKLVGVISLSDIAGKDDAGALKTMRRLVAREARA